MDRLTLGTATPTGDPHVDRAVAQVVAVARPLRVIAFGSRIAGTPRPDSDVDLLVVLPDGTPCRQAMAEIGARLPIGPVEVDVLVATPAVLDCHHNNPGLIYRTILRHGRDVYAAPRETVVL